MEPFKLPSPKARVVLSLTGCWLMASKGAGRWHSRLRARFGEARQGCENLSRSKVVSTPQETSYCGGSPYKGYEDPYKDGSDELEGFEMRRDFLPGPLWLAGLVFFPLALTFHSIWVKKEIRKGRTDREHEEDLSEPHQFSNDEAAGPSHDGDTDW